MQLFSLPRLSLLLFAMIFSFTLSPMTGAQSARKKPLGNYKIFFDLKDVKVSKEALALQQFWQLSGVTLPCVRPPQTGRS